MPEILEIKNSKSNSAIPILNGIHLHSIYDPRKEAEIFVENNIKQIKNNNKFLILGLGYAYHIDALLQELEANDYFIYVIEPSKILIDSFQKERPFNDHRIRIKHLGNISNVYQDTNFIDFLSEKPSILVHTTSFNMHQNSYKSFLNYKASTFITDYKNNISAEIREKFEGKPSNWNLGHYLENINSLTKIENESDFFLLGLSALILDGERL